MGNFIEFFKERTFETLPDTIIHILPKIIGFAAVLIIGFWLSNLAGKLLVKILEKNKVDSSMHRFLMRMLVVMLKVVVFVVALDQIGININSFVTAIGAAGITAGLGLQNSIAQFAGGVQILFNKPFKSGDYIEIDGVQGKVREIRFMYTTLITNDNKIVVVPNLNMTTKNLINYTSQGVIRVDLVYYIGYGDDIDKAKKVLHDVADRNGLVEKTPKPVVGVCEHGASGVGITLFAWCDSKRYWDTFFSLQEDVKKAANYVIAAVLSNTLDNPEWRLAPDNREGVRILFSLDGGVDNAWFMLRLSVHDPVMAVNAESDVPGGLRRILTQLCKVLEMDNEELDLTPLKAAIDQLETKNNAQE